MTTMKPSVQKQRADGFFPVYIRVTHDRRTAFIKTNKLVDRKSVNKNNEIRDNAVLKYCTELIGYYTQRLNLQDTSKWTVKEVVAFLSTEETDASFSDYAKLHIARMVNEGHERNSKNYKLAVQHLERYMGTTQVMFSYLTTAVLQRWIGTLAQTNRAKEMYPTCIRQIFKAALIELNDDERGICRIKFNPWIRPGCAAHNHGRVQGAL